MDLIVHIATTLLAQLQTPTLAFLMGGMVLAACGSKLQVPQPVYAFIVILLLLKVGLGAGISLRSASLEELMVPAFAAVAVGVLIVILGRAAMIRNKSISEMDAMATIGVFGAVSASTLAAGMSFLEDRRIAFEGFIAALYPFMDVAALITAIVLAKSNAADRASGTADGTIVLAASRGAGRDLLGRILTDTLRSPAVSALLLGLAIGLFARPETVYASFYEPLFRGLLSILMLIMGMEAWSRLAELRKVAHVYILYGLTAPLVHGFIGFAAGLLVHQITGFSEGGIVLLAIMAASSSDISGPPTMRGALPDANPSAYVGTSTGLGTPVAILSIPLWVTLASLLVGT